MNCPSCNADNPTNNRFCGACGAAQESRCPACQHANPPDYRFCGGCGVALSDLPSPASVATTTAIQPTPAPKHLVEKILQSKSALEGERKQVTVLFADVKGSMDLAEQLDTEEWSAIMQRFFKILCEGVERFEGFVDKFTGDGIMALFGAPIAHEDHAQRACYAALHLRSSLRAYADELRRTQGVSLSVRIGLNSGDVVVGTIGNVGNVGDVGDVDKSGNQLRMEYTAQGHTVGLAQRMEQLAAADNAYLTEHTAALVEGYFELRNLGAFDLKGVSDPLAVYELQGVGAMRSRLDRSRARGFSRLVGRTDELAVLETAFNRSLEGRGGVIGIVADAGVGKSRLCNEFVERARARGIAVYEAHCPSHGKVVPLLPILEMFRDFFGIAPNDSDQLAREKIAGRLLLLDRELEPYLPLAFEFLGVSDPDNPAPDLPAAVRQRELITFTRRLIQARSTREPAVLFFDDVHWIDESSDAFLAQVADVVPGTRTMLLLNFRPEYSAEWMGRASYQQLPLHPLGPEAIDALVTDLLGSDSSVAHLPALMRERTGGNPFFIEEIIHSLAESGKLVGGRGDYRLEDRLDRLEIPPTVHGILAARIDRLPEAEKSVLQTAAAIGLRFTDRLLRRVCELSSDDVDGALAALRSAEFIHEESLYPEIEYAFRHPLTHEVAERSQLAAHRRHVHLAVAGALEQLHSDKLDENAALLAHHWDLGGDVEQAALWHRRAADCIAGGNVREAARHWQRVRDLADEIGDPVLARELGGRSRVMLIECAWRYGVTLDEAEELFREGEEWARREDDPHALAQLYNASAIVVTLGFGQLSRGRKLCEDGLKLARETGDEGLAFALGIRLALILDYAGDVRASRSTFESIDACSESTKESASVFVGYDAPAFALAYLGVSLANERRLDEGNRHIERAIELARARGSSEVLGWALTFESEGLLVRTDYAGAARAAQESMEIAERIENPLSRVIAGDQLARVLMAQGRLDEAATHAEQSIAEAAGTLRPTMPVTMSVLARIRSMQGRREDARRIAHEAFTVAESEGFGGARLAAELALAELALQEAEPEEAAGWLVRAEESLQITGASIMEPDWLELRAELARQRGAEVERERLLREALEIYREMRASAQVARLEQELGA